MMVSILFDSLKGMESHIKSLNKKVVRSWSSTYGIVEGIDRVAEGIKATSGMQCDRSKLLNALSELLLDVKETIDATSICNQESLKQSLLDALKRHW